MTQTALISVSIYDLIMSWFNISCITSACGQAEFWIEKARSLVYQVNDPD